MNSVRRLLWWLGYKPRHARVTPEVAEAVSTAYSAINEARDTIQAIATRDAMAAARKHQNQLWR